MILYPNSDCVEDMEIILALDLMGNMVVHGSRGERAGYRPLTWGISPTAEPSGYVSNVCPRFLYIADLGRIQGRAPHDDAVRVCAGQVERCYLDRGCTTPADYVAMDRVVNVVGTETGSSTLEGLRSYPGGYLSIDIKAGRVIPWNLDPSFVLAEAEGMSFEGCIILNIGAVGTEEGLLRGRLELLRSSYSGRLLYGGGVAGEQDIGMLEDAGFDGAIIATAVHRGTVPLDWVRKGYPC